MAPAELTLGAATELLEHALQLPRLLGRHPEHDDDVWAVERPVRAVRAGWARRGAVGERRSRRRSSVPKDMELDDVTLEDAIEWLRFPKLLGLHPDSGEEVTVRPGRWGPYVQAGAERRNVKPPDDLETIELERAVQLLAEPKGRRGGARRRTTRGRRG